MKSFLKKCEPSKRQALLRKFATIPPENDEWLHNWVEIYLGVSIPRKQVCEHHVAPFTAFADAYFARTPISVWKASRGFGAKTFMLSLLGVTELITLGANIRLLGGSGDQSRNINEYMSGHNPRVQGTFWECPRAPKHLLTSTTKNEIRTKNGGYVKALMASQTSVRGAHPTRLRIDEADELELGIFDAALGQTMHDGRVKPQTVISSTHQHADGTFTDVIRRARERGWGFYEWCLYENEQPHGWLRSDEIERKRLEVPDHMWDTEYLGQEPNPEGRIFRPEVLAGIFDKSLGVFEGQNMEVCRTIPPNPEETFYHGADWGYTRDWTVLHTMRKSKAGPDQLACWSRLRDMPPNLMIGEYNHRVEEYGGAGAHDETGTQKVNSSYLMVDSEGVDFSRRKMIIDMYSSYVSAAETGDYVYPMIRPLYDAHKYLTLDQLYGKKHIPDEIVAAALAWYAREVGAFDLLVGRAF